MCDRRRSIAHDNKEQAILEAGAETTAQADQEDERARDDRNRSACASRLDSRKHSCVAIGVQKVKA